MRLLMKKSVDGSPDGMRTERFIEGRVYDLGSSTRARELGEVFIREQWAELASADAGADAAPADTRDTAKPVYRLPLLEEYVTHGYKADGYDEFLKQETAAAEKAGFRVEVRAKNAEELEKEEVERAAFAAREAEIEKQRQEREAAAVTPSAPDVVQPAPTPPVASPTPPETPKSKSKPSKAK